MKQIYILLFLVGFASCAFAQVEFNNKFKAIPPLNTAPKPEKKSIPPANNQPVIIPPNVYKNPIVHSPPNPVSDYKVNTKSEISMIPKKEFIDPGDEIREKLSNSVGKTLVREGLKEDTSYLVKKDVNFGEIRTKSAYLVVKCRDFGAIDGDCIKAVNNTDVVEYNLQLQAYYKEFRVNLKDGINIFVLEALNRGALGGNTGEFYIYDAEGKLITSQIWDNWDSGVKGKFVIVKE